jgi:NOL1/NOP2/sun family putative RNA methylase
MLPIDFVNRMKTMLGVQYDSFIESYSKESYKSLRINPLKGDLCKLINSTNWDLNSIPWCANGYYYDPATQPGKHPLHEAGAYYIQEASAMLPAVLLNVKPGDKVLDLCAAPGGKSTQIALAMNNQGLLVSNEIIPNRAKILSENIERMGIRNAIVTNADSETLANKFPVFFNKIMVDAPCSGEGMFRKNPEACNEWSLENVNICANRQLEILENAAKMLAPGGRMVYSTCTFSPEENEGTIYRFLKNHPEFSLVDSEINIDGFDNGHFEYLKDADLTFKSEIEKCIRLWPHKIDGEGHFAAMLEKKSDNENNHKIKAEKGINPKE